MRKILKRTITGIIYVALLVMATTCGAGYFAGVFGLLLILGIIELSNLCNKGIKSYKLLTTLDVIGGVSLFASTFLSLYDSEWKVPFLIAYLPYVIVRLISQLYIKDSNSIRLLSTSFLSQVIVALPLTLLNYTYFVYGTNTTVLACLIFIWMNDTGAYCVGSMIGNRRLFERI